MNFKVIACIPAYNEEKTIAKVILKTKKYVDKVIVCDDGSIDMTAEIAEALGAEVIRHERNMGYGAAISSLFKKAVEEGADIMVTLDGDGQHDPDEIPKLIKPIVEDEADVVIGSRF
ncbi:MAG: glycosyltransferase family 2 protein, partial [Nitrososphaerota archaeon]